MLNDYNKKLVELKRELKTAPKSVRGKIKAEIRQVEQLRRSCLV